jgi:enoyl-CoA hydratase/carnithine racemase
MLLKTKLNSQGVFHITLNRPQKHHALNCELLEQLNANLAQAYTNPEIKAILIASQGKVFCAGADLNDMREKTDQVINLIVGLIQVMQKRTVPIWMALEGNVYGGGSILLGLADVIIASRTSEVIMPEIKSHIWPVFLIPILKPHLPHNVLMDMAMNVTSLSAERAHQLGWFSRLVAPGDALDVALHHCQTYCHYPKTVLETCFQCQVADAVSILTDKELAICAQRLRSLIRRKSI